ncbi:MAG: hypothetical protein HYU31_12780 [Deltaproteobacteria bacterium]|nr:hypothetical protein [Deltaproteobacteria bacterium]MBI2181677.1 hypothetical protein [Deltaproteobacteria bacterium]MBI2366652.1 hypothetical protein [Deltaproteobacteria bacterium]MBI3066347.1 hypothetical protein [Deltaproteobacteria bacterium]
MARSKQNNEARLQELIGAAKQKNIEVRTEKLLREVGYRARSGRCRIMGQDVILLDRDAPVGDQIDFLASALADENSDRA